MHLLPFSVTKRGSSSLTSLVVVVWNWGLALACFAEAEKLKKKYLCSLYSLIEFTSLVIEVANAFLFFWSTDIYGLFSFLSLVHVLNFMGQKSSKICSWKLGLTNLIFVVFLVKTIIYTTGNWGFLHAQPKCHGNSNLRLLVCTSR